MASKLLVVFICAILFVALLGANAAVALDRGAFNAEHVKSAAEEEGLYAAIDAELAATLESELTADSEFDEDIDIAAILDDALTEEYIQSQAEANIDRVYAHLHGEADLEIIIDLTPVKAALEDAIAAEMADIDLAEFGFDEIVLDEYDITIDLDALSADAASYTAERDAFEEAVKVHIQEETEEELSEEELEASARDLIEGDLRDDLNDLITVRTTDADIPESMEEPLQGLGALYVEALTTDLSFDAFDSERATLQEALGEAAATHFLEEMDDEFPSTIDLSDEITNGGVDFTPIQTAVSIIGTLGIVLPIVSLGLVGGLYGLTKREDTVLLSAGTVGLLVGVISLVPALVVPSLVADAIADIVPEAFADIVVGMVAALFDPLLMQSIGLAVVGGIAIGLAVAIRRDLLPLERFTGADE